MSQTKTRKNKSNFLVLLSFLAIGLLGYTLTSSAQYRNDIETDTQQTSFIYKVILKNSLDAGNVKSGPRRVSFDNAQAMEEFYKEHEHGAIWVGGHDLSQATEALQILENAWTHGLNPEQYHVREIREQLERPFLTDKARVELLLTDAAIRYGQDLSGMRFDPALIKQRSEYWRMPLKAEAVVEKIMAADNAVDGLRALEPKTKLYRALQEELVRLTNEESGYDHVLPMSFGGDHHFTPRERHKDVAALRVRLGVEYDPKQGPESFYDDKTAAAVMKFQRGHGLEPDGIIGPRTLAVLNRTQKERMEQIIANMERLRWLDQDRPSRYILVNIPQQLLWAVEDGKVAHEMKVVVGLPYRRTKEFKTEITGVRFNPEWTVPLSLKMRDFLPKLKKDPSYLAEKGIEIIKGYGRNAMTLDPHAIDWHSIGWREMGKMRFVQSSGDHNALGRIRVLMNNRYNIYMHDTNHPEYFERGQRTYSSGCIRLSEPEKIADFILKDNQDWSVQARESLIAEGETVEVDAVEPFPVYIIYQSIWQDEKGRLVFGPDVYKRDKELIKVLANINGYQLPEIPEMRYAGSGADEDSRALAYNQ